jgi:AcrR family transcriptional regulator
MVTSSLTLSADLTAAARIRNAALEQFAQHGVAASSVREIAKAADVSPGLVQHHFPTKLALREAVNDYVASIARQHFNDLPSTGSPVTIQQEIGDRVTSFVREHPTLLRYVARSAADRDEGALLLFDTFFAIARTQWERLAEAGLVRSDADITWTALQGVVMPLATVLLQPAIERHLPAGFFTTEQLDRWNLAMNALFREGVYRPSHRSEGTR